MSPSPKKYLTIGEQAQLLESRGMELDGNPEQWLKSTNYYRLSGYWYTSRRLETTAEGAPSRSDQFRPGTKFSEVAALYEFDRKLRSLVHVGLERVEVALRSQVSYVLGRYGPLSYEDKSLFRDAFNHSSWVDKTHERVKRAARRSMFINHHMQNHAGVIPIWVLVEVLDFSDVSMLYDGMRATDQFDVAEGMGICLRLDRLSQRQRGKAVKHHPFARWLEQLTVVRNISAHHGRLWNRSLVPAATGAMRTIEELESLPPGQSEDLYGALAVIAQILTAAAPDSNWALKVASEVERGFAALPGRDVSEMGFPGDWRDVDVWRA
ncbi:Abi family protein [Pseudoclavibacter sp. 8L]|uniref:Abi family protein n=1 Tax=Pseudoclavibacter sp. 8L TaxID=2653162 RepID=UPI0012EF68F1|nr:Abi family protein [Pseudoclavibacter sp. 8L]VXC06123.1 CAAX protease [Pseudoclavibacter sp. 8L]